MNLYALLASRFPADRSAPCLILPDGRVIDYAQLESQSARYGALLASSGLQPGERIAAQTGKSPEALFLYLGCLRAGCVYLPLNPAYTRSELAYFLDNARPGLFVCAPARLEEAQSLATQTGVARVQTLGHRGEGSLPLATARMPERFETVRRADEDLAALLYTSGTTGRSKGVMLSHRNLAANALVLHEYWGFRQGDVLLHMLPIFHTHGLFVATHCVLLNGSAMLFEPRFDAARALPLMRAATVFMGVPTYYTRLLQEPGLTPEAVANMRLFISGSAPLLPDTFAQFRNRTGHTLLERYGMTEGGMFTSNPLEGERRGGTVGHPLPETRVRVCTEEDAPVLAGEIGQVQVHGANIFSGYWQMPEKTQEEFTADGFFRTGDLGRFDTEGYLWLVGRNKDLIISGGLNIYPKEIEEAIDSLPGVMESAVIGLPHTDFGEAVTAIVVREAAGDPPDAETLLQPLRERLAGFKLPKFIHFVDELPRNAMGKVQKNILRQQFSS